MSERALPVVDLEARLGLGLERGGDLLRDDERAVVDVLLALHDDAALLHARLVGRVPVAFRVPELTAPGVASLADALATLRAAGLVTEDVPWTERAAEATRAVLAAGCRRVGLAATGSRAQLEARLQALTDWDDAVWIRLPHRVLVVRLERWGTLSAWPDRADPVLERLGLRRPVPYATTSGAAIAPDRATWDTWEQLAERWSTLSLDEVLDAIERPVWPPGRLDLRRRLTDVALEGLRVLEVADPAAARTAYRRLRAAGFGGVEPALREALLAERLDGPRAGLAVATAARSDAGVVGRLALARTGRRLAKAAGVAWPPDPPLRAAGERRIRLLRVEGDGPRPRYATSASADAWIEDAVAARLRDAGRTVIAAENVLWHTVVGLLLADVMFLPIPGVLPVPRLSAPLDWGTPAFRQRRTDAVAAQRARVAAGDGPALLDDAWGRYDGQAVAGVVWDVAPRAQVVAAVAGLGATGTLAVLDAWLDHGREARAGLPDLCVLPGPAVVVPDVFPSRLPDGLVLVEVKGESDTLRDAQRVWHDRLLTAGVPTEVWWVDQPRSS